MPSEPPRPALYWEAMAPHTRQAFEKLTSLPVLNDFYLAGGTALALQIGHRISYDLDFFSSQNELGTAERAKLGLALQQIDSVEIKLETAGQLYASIQGVEASFIFQPHPLLFPTINVQGIRLAQATDIGLMKLAAVKDRGTRRDFVDLYCLRHVAPLSNLFQLLPQKYYDRPDFSVHLAYALCYFEDAETDPQQLNMIQKIDWEAVKTYCLEGSRLLSKMNAGLEPPL
jgi:hypothetical protein